MKNIIQINTIAKCCLCKLNSFFCTTPNGADYNTCPLCCRKDFLNQQTDDKYKFLDDDDNRNKLSFCPGCKIIFLVGCTHLVLGCTDNIYNAHLISKWIDLTTNEEYIGMPQFDDEDEWFEKACNIKILDFICPNNNLICKSSSNYSFDKKPEYYNDCNLKK
jgi:hypothetical protein